MFFRRFFPVLIGIHHRIALIGLLTFIVSPNLYPQQQIAQDAYAIFERSCLICHGPDGAYKETLLMEHDALIENGTVVPGNPDASELYNRLLGEGGALMPLGGPPLPDLQIDTIKNWILTGAPDWTATSTTDGDFISPAEMLNTIETHLMSLAPFDRAYARYFTMTHLYNAGKTPSILQAYRKGLYKLVNSLSWGSTVINPQPVGPQETILYIDLRNYEWDVNDGWTTIEAEYPYHVAFDAPTQTGLKEQLTRLQTEMKCDIPSVHVDWFLARASLPPLYHDLLDLPVTDRELETRLEVDVIRNLLNAPGVRVWRAGTNNSGVSNNNRVIERHTSRYGAYWKSYDFAGSVGTQNIFTHPLSFTHDGGEVVFNLPNGLQGYYVTNATGFRLDDAPINIVSNPAASDPTVRNGLSCFGCHTEGMKTFEDEVRAVIESSATPNAQALRLYVEKSVMDAFVEEDMDRYRQALEATGGVFDDIEPISRFHEAFQGPVDAAHAAAAVGLETETFLERIRENIALQNIGLLVLDSENGSVKRDTWTSNFIAMIYALDFPEAEVDSPSQPDRLPGTVVRIPDLNLHAAIAEELGKSPNASITVEEMERLRHLEVPGRGIQDLTGLQFATNLEGLILGWWGRGSNQVSDLSPIAGLINLRRLYFNNNPVSDISPLRGLKNLTELSLYDTLVSDISIVGGFKNLTRLALEGVLTSDLSPVAGLVNMEILSFSNENISDLSPLTRLIKLRKIFSWGNSISDLSPLAGLTKMEHIDLCGGNISDLTPLASLASLEELYLRNEEISDISPLAGLTGLKRLGLGENDITDLASITGLTQLEWLNLSHNKISDVSPLASLANLTWLDLSNNGISNFSPLDGLRGNIKLIWYGNPAFPKGGPKIEGPWLWVALPGTRLSSDTDLLAEASGGAVTEAEIATHGATVGQAVADSVWTPYNLPPTGDENISHMLRDSIYKDNVHPNPGAALYGSVSLYSPREQNTTMYVGGDDGVKVWLNGTLIYERIGHRSGDNYTDFFPVTLQHGRNVLLVAVYTWGNGFFGFEPGTDYTLSMGVGYTISPTPVHAGDTFTLDIRAENVTDLAGWQFDIAFDPAVLEAISVTEGDFLKTDGGSTFFHGGSIDNAAGKIGGLTAAQLSGDGATGTGTLLQVTFKAKAAGETQLTLQNFQFGSTVGDDIPAGPHEIYLTVEEQLATGDVNRDGVISILDLVLIVRQLGQSVPAGSAVDLNGDGRVTVLDLILVAQRITGSPAAPPVGTESVDAAMIEAWIAQARLEDDGSLVFKQGIEILENLLASLIPEETALLRNYPNPFNPETWIPYQLAKPADVTLAIYDINGQQVRRLAVGHQAAGTYRTQSRAVHWDGRNQLGESVASGVYFYSLTAGEFTGTRRMLIIK